uniref:Uncharacterized protein n=1 Tax=Setaria viridis TaxID=4556 RepID=A0A4U6UNV1_SETVI|nr:hypothetical protein SEVIR_5G034850v2 [Setaria viridis]
MITMDICTRYQFSVMDICTRELHNTGFELGPQGLIW